jgi:F420-non-reducing hydrogenase small subunit
VDKLKFAIYWAASCGGCDVAILDVNEKILDVIEIADIVFWPCAMDFKYSDVEAMEDDYIDVCLFNGAIRTSEHEEIAKLLRRKSKVMVAYGACSCFGGIPGLANLANRDEIFERAYLDSPSTHNPEKVTPKTLTHVEEGDLKLPEFYDTVHSLGQVVEVDYLIPGCPPPPDLTMKAVEAIATGNLPPKGSTIAGEKSLCDECPREKSEKVVIEKFRRPHEVLVEEPTCFLEEGVICCGPATRSGCGARCIKVNMPCRGCFGPTANVTDQGAKMLSAIASIYQAQDEEAVDEMVKSLVDPVGTFYRFGLPVSILRRRAMEPSKPQESDT